MTLGVVILLMVLLSILCFILDGIVAPSQHMLARMELYRVEREVQSVERHKRDVRSDVLTLLQRTARNLIDHMPRYTLWNLVHMAHLKETDAKFREESRQRLELLDSCQDEQVQEIRNSIVVAGDRVLFWNAVSWNIWVVPIAVCVVMYDALQKAVKTLITTPQSIGGDLWHDGNGQNGRLAT